jgi:hypothetical protein
MEIRSHERWWKVKKLHIIHSTTLNLSSFFKNMLKCTPPLPPDTFQYWILFPQKTQHWKNEWDTFQYWFLPHTLFSMLPHTQFNIEKCLGWGCIFLSHTGRLAYIRIFKVSSLLTQKKNHFRERELLKTVAKQLCHVYKSRLSRNGWCSRWWLSVISDVMVSLCFFFG